MVVTTPGQTSCTESEYEDRLGQHVKILLCFFQTLPLLNHFKAVHKLGPSRKGGGRFFRFVQVWGSSRSDLGKQCINGWGVRWPYGRGRQKFCLQKSSMPLAGLVYLRFLFASL